MTIEIMKNAQEDKQITMEEALDIPELADLHEAIRYVQNTPFKKMFPEKYERSINRTIILKTRRLFETSPTMPLKNVVATVLNSLKDDLSAELLQTMTQVIIEEWTRLSTAISENRRVEEMV